MSSSWLRSIFEREGRVDDVFISKKIRKFKKDALGFVRFRSCQDVVNAIINLNGFLVRGLRLRVSMATFKRQNSTIKGHVTGYRRIKIPSFRDQRKYSEVLMGKQHQALKGEWGNNVIPILLTHNAAENRETVKMLEHTIIA